MYNFAKVSKEEEKAELALVFYYNLTIRHIAHITRLLAAWTRS